MTDDRLPVIKTYKLFIGGALPRSESGRSVAVGGEAGRPRAYVSLASRKDLRDAVEAARKAQPGWAGASAYNRGQVLYRLAEMMEGKRAELAESIDAGAAAGGRGSRTASARPSAARREVEASIDRVVSFAGWCDKYAQVLGGCNPVAGPYYNFTAPEPVGVVAVVAPDAPALLSLVSLMMPALCAGSAVVAVASVSAPLPAAVLAEAIATSDMPGGVVNILTAARSELLAHVASHRDVDAVHAGNLDAKEAGVLRGGAAENLKRVCVREGVDWFDARACTSPEWIEPLVDMKTTWHPSST